MARTLGTIGTFAAAGCIVSFVFGTNFFLESPVLQGLVYGELFLSDDKTYECNGTETVTFENKTIKVSDGNGIVASDRCELELINCDIEGDIALVVEDNAKVKAIDSTLRGDVAAIDARDQGKVELVNTTTDGDVNRSGKARVDRP